MRCAIIPARGGSKRIPRKNIKEFSGKPIIYHVIKAAQSSGLFEKIIVSTDDEEIANIACSFGAEIIKRPDDLSDDYTPTRPVIRHAINVTELETGQKVKEVCVLYATAAFVMPADLQEALDNIKGHEFLFSFSATSYPHPIQRAFYEVNDNELSMFDESKRTTRTQDLTEYYHDCGMFYFGKSEGFFSDEPMFGTKSKIVKIPKNRAFDIDDIEDWQMAEAVFKANKKCMY